MIYPPRNAAYELERLAAKLEAAEKDIALKEKVIDALGSELNAVANERDGLLDCLNEWKALAKSAEKERDELRSKIEQMEQQEPVAKVRVHRTGGNAGLAWSVAPLNDFDSLPLMRDGDKALCPPRRSTGGQAMNPTEATTILRQFNEWRRGDYAPEEQPTKPDPVEISEAIDAAVEMIERLEAAEKETASWKGLAKQFGNEADNLRSKIEQMEKQEPVAHVWRCDNGQFLGLSERFLPMGTKLYALPGAAPEAKP